MVTRAYRHTITTIVVPATRKTEAENPSGARARSSPPRRRFAADVVADHAHGVLEHGFAGVRRQHPEGPVLVGRERDAEVLDGLDLADSIPLVLGHGGSVGFWCVHSLQS